MTLPLKMESVVLGHGIEDRSLNYLIYCYKYYIYKCKLSSEMPRPQNFKLFIDQKLKAEEKKFEICGKIDIFKKEFDFDIKSFM
jgi:hypothetical protein